ncbi:MAG: S24 family peptidase [Candidatus Pacebacteria bacterium]|nr:S24 family peptidase [Candidatus Paceibacterota bacterium]
MHIIQKNLLKEINKKALSGMTLRKVGSLVGEKSAQKIKHHLTQLSKKGFIAYNPAKREIKKAQKISKEGFVSLPIIGTANCGPATIFAEENITGYLKVSKKLAPRGGKLFVLRAEGDSMNRANINRKNIEDGDFVIVDEEQKSPEPGQYIISIIDEMANIKKFVPDPKNERVVLKSESTKEYLPIFIHENDNYQISGKVIDVIKK